MTDINPELIEKVAIATYDAMQHPNWRAPLWDEIDEPGRERFLNAARAALEAVADDLRAEGATQARNEEATQARNEGAMTNHTFAANEAKQREAEPDPLDENDHQDRVLSGGGRIARHGPRHWHTPTVGGGPWCKWACSGLSLADWNRHNGPLTFASEAEPDPLDEDDHRDRQDRDGMRLTRVASHHWHSSSRAQCGLGCNGLSLANWNGSYGPLAFAPDAPPDAAESENGVEVGSDTDDAPEPLLCPECGHDLEDHDAYCCECPRSPAGVAYALIADAVKAERERLAREVRELAPRVIGNQRTLTDLAERWEDQ